MEERRQDYPEIKNRLTIIETNWNNFQKSYDEWKIESKEWRITLCGKIDKVLKQLNDLPCKERLSWYKSIDKQVAFMWLVIGAIFTVGAGLFIENLFK